MRHSTLAALASLLCACSAAPGGQPGRDAGPANGRDAAGGPEAGAPDTGVDVGPTPTDASPPNEASPPNDAPGSSDTSPPPGVFAWRTLRVGAGGYVRGMDIAPDGTLVSRTDTYGAYVWSGSAWQQLITSASMPASVVAVGNNAGVYELRIAPSSTSTFYMSYLGNVYVSQNKGQSWTQTAFANVTTDANDGVGQFGQKMAVDPHNPSIVFVGTPQMGLFVTRDAGATWQGVAGVPTSGARADGTYPGITGIVFDPSTGAGGTTTTLFASSYGHGVYRSTDGGNTWTALAGGPNDADYGAIASTGAYYAAGNDTSSVWRYASGAWTQVVASTDVGGNGVQAVAVDPMNGAHVVMLTPGGTVNQSFDGGQTWSGLFWMGALLSADIPWLAASSAAAGTTPMPGSAAQGFMDIGGAAFDPLVPGKLYASAGVGVWNTTALPPAVMPGNPTVTWNDQSAGIEQLVANQIVVPPGGKPVLASWDRPFFYAGNVDQYPATYSPVASDTIVAGWSIDYASSTPSFLVGIADWWGVEESGYSSDGGQTWKTFASTPPGASSAYMGGTIAASSPMNIVWAPADKNQPYYTTNGGTTWSPVTLPGVSSWSGFDFAYYLDTRTVAADRVTPNTFYLFYAGNGVYATSDGGATWTQTYSGDLSNGDGYNAELMAVPGQAGHLFFTGGPQSGTPPGTEPFLRSKDGGVTWNPVPNLVQIYCFGFGAPKAAGGYPAIYVVGWVNGVYGVWQSDDDAQTWSTLGAWPNGSLDTIKTIAGDPGTYGEVYVGFGGSGYAYYGP